MKSYKQAYRKLPEEFLEIAASQYGEKELDKILDGFMCQRYVTLRANRLKTDVRKVMETFRKENIKHERVIWYEDALIIRNKLEKDLESHKLYQEGHIYLQSLSSMIPPLALNPSPGSNILDLTAAPGSKTTQLAALMENSGFILANELNPIRAERLKFNAQRQGADIVHIRIGDGKKLEDKWHQFFDYVLLDAPCSGTGLFTVNNPGSYRGWSKRKLSSIVKEQRKLLETALWALKPGGSLVYSTCSIIKEENEHNTAWFLDKYSDVISLENISLKLSGSEIFCRPVGSGKYKNGMLLIFPTELYEGFFVAKFKKNKALSE